MSSYEHTINEIVQHTPMAYDVDFVRAYLTMLAAEAMANSNADDDTGIPRFCTPAARQLFHNLIEGACPTCLATEVTRAAAGLGLIQSRMFQALADDLPDNDLYDHHREVWNEIAADLAEYERRHFRD